MIKKEKINIGVNSRNLKHLLSLGYDAKVGINMEVFSTDLCDNSDIRINAICKICGETINTKKRTYTKSLKSHNFYCCKDCAINKNKLTNLERHDVEHTFQKKEFVEKRKENNIDKTGVGCSFQYENVKDKIKTTNLKNFGFEYASQHQQTKDKMKLTRIERKLQLPDEQVSDFILYKRKILCLTNKNKKILLNNWDGFDYYDNEYIKDNFSLNGNNRLYPSLDHKISIYYGFINNIDVNTVGGILNLCFTKNWINSLKNIKNEDEFKIILENKKAS